MVNTDKSFQYLIKSKLSNLINELTQLLYTNLTSNPKKLNQNNSRIRSCHEGWSHPSEINCPRNIWVFIRSENGAAKRLYIDMCHLAQ